jgi:hypothetical protein
MIKLRHARAPRLGVSLRRAMPSDDVALFRLLAKDLYAMLEGHDVGTALRSLTSCRARIRSATWQACSATYSSRILSQCAMPSSGRHIN